MKTPSRKLKLQSQVETVNVDKEVKSYIYQSISEFEPYVTPNTLIAVIAKDPLKLASRLEEEGQEIDREKWKNFHRIAITLTEDGTKLEEEAVHENVFDAIRLAKEKLLKNLSELQDSAISNQERMVQIREAKAGSNVH
ncbi:MAG: hypothetical protein LW875_12155 [Proteobacteria bacterium]|jgi:ribosome-associated translation inhibitor RaiA|nr:hypothetical protein [Pseudomonadota bacterium]